MSGALPSDGSLHALTPAQRSVLELAARGLCDKEIAARQGIGTRTVRFHFARAIASIGAANRTQGIALAVKLGLIGVDASDVPTSSAGVAGVNPHESQQPSVPRSSSPSRSLYQSGHSGRAVRADEYE